MKFLEIPPTNETLKDYIIPALFKKSKAQPAQKMLETLSSYTGISMTNLVPSAVQHLLNEKNTEVAVEFGKLEKTKLRST